MNFCPLASPPKADNGVGKRFRNSCVSRKAKQKNFRFLNWKNFGGARIKKCKENFSVLSTVRRAETLGGIQSAKSSGFCSKKVLTSSSRHHHIELVASLGASPLASAGIFESKLKSFLKSIENSCWLIWRFANLKSLLVFEKQTADFFLSPLAKGKARFY